MNRARAEEIAATFMRPELRDTLPRAYAAFLCANAIMEAVAEEREACAVVCEQIADDYAKREGMKYAEMKTDAQTGATNCEYAIRSRNEQPESAKDSQ